MDDHINVVRSSIDLSQGSSILSRGFTSCAILFFFFGGGGWGGGGEDCFLAPVLLSAQLTVRRKSSQPAYVFHANRSVLVHVKSKVRMQKVVFLLH